MTTVTTPSLANRLIKVYLIIMIILHAFNTLLLSMDYYYWLTANDPARPDWPVWFPALPALANFVSLTALMGVWFWKRRAFILYLTIGGVSFLLSVLILQVPIRELLPSLISLAIFTAIFGPRFNRLT